MCSYMESFACLEPTYLSLVRLAVHDTWWFWSPIEKFWWFTGCKLIRSLGHISKVVKFWNTNCHLSLNKKLKGKFYCFVMSNCLWRAHRIQISSWRPKNTSFYFYQGHPTRKTRNVLECSFCFLTSFYGLLKVYLCELTPFDLFGCSSWKFKW